MILEGLDLSSLLGSAVINEEEKKKKFHSFPKVCSFLIHLRRETTFKSKCSSLMRVNASSAFCGGCVF